MVIWGSGRAAISTSPSKVLIFPPRYGATMHWYSSKHEPISEYISCVDIPYSPDRWDSLDHSTTLPGLGNVMTFGFGPHSCLGYKFTVNEMKVFLATILPQFTFTPAEGVEITKLNSILTRPYIKDNWELGTQLPINVSYYTPWFSQPFFRIASLSLYQVSHMRYCDAPVFLMKSKPRWQKNSDGTSFRELDSYNFRTWRIIWGKMDIWIYGNHIYFTQHRTSGCEDNGLHPLRQRLNIIFWIRMTDVIDKWPQRNPCFAPLRIHQWRQWNWRICQWCIHSVNTLNTFGNQYPEAW